MGFVLYTLIRGRVLAPVNMAGSSDVRRIGSKDAYKAILANPGASGNVLLYLYDCQFFTDKVCKLSPALISAFTR